MTEPTEEPGHHGTTEPVFTEARDVTCLTETFEKTVNVSQDGGLSEETDRLEDRQQDGQRDRQAVSPESKWVVGSQCLAVWSEDAQVYPATVLSVDGERCRVCFHDYGNEEEVELSTLRQSDTATQRQNSQDWKPGSQCRAVYSEDGLVYPAVVLSVKGQRCRVRFDNYNIEEEQEVSNLLNPDELHGPSRISTAKVKQSLSQTNVDREEKKRDAEKPTNHSFPFFPPFPPPPQSSSADPVTFIPPPPPPPLWTFGRKESGVDSASNMLLLWYTCGFHTGCYMAQQNFRSSSKD
ncbi:survival motor neuron protein isoform X2 [Larimichthys crocea]|uniref:survival motor neuron protein isoform X2 n=1 Tax=Larimichthys crocea TaxID=215358 RepID=UPI000F5EE653|nr:survival motor neuron protein isoform X2 [Larimichthys crocea]